MNLVGKIDKNKLGKFANIIITEKVIITDERMEHIKEHHPELEYKAIKSIKSVVEDPDYILRIEKILIQYF